MRLPPSLSAPALWGHPFEDGAADKKFRQALEQSFCNRNRKAHSLAMEAANVALGVTGDVAAIEYNVDIVRSFVDSQ
jgi:hypothetical protein